MPFRKSTLVVVMTTLAFLISIASAGYAVVDFKEVVAVSAAIEGITIEGREGFYLPPGTDGQLVAETFPSGLGQHVRWKVVGQDDDVAVTLDAGSGFLSVPETSGTGWITVQASAEGCAPKTKRIEIGCGCGGQHGTCDATPGAATIANGSVDVRMSLGQGGQGRPAGNLLLHAEEPLAVLSTPEALLVDSAGRDVQPLYRNDRLEQILTPQVIVSFVRFSPLKYEIHFYDVAYRGTRTEDGLYSIDPTAEPLVVWRIANPDAGGNSVDELVITELRGGAAREFYYRYASSDHGWSLVSGNGLKIESKAESFNDAGDRVVRTEIAGADGTPVRVEETIRHAFPFGEKRIREIVDPDGAALTTRYRYGTKPGPGHGKLIARIDPDGGWVRYGYDDEGRIIREVKPFLDAPFDAPGTAAEVETTSYAPVDGADKGSKRDRQHPRQVIETVCGIETARTYYAYIRKPDGSRTEITERATAQGRPYGHPANLRAVASYYPSGTQGPEAGRIKSRCSEDGLLTTYTYETGRFEQAINPAKCRFIPGKGPARRTTATYGTVAHPEGIPYRTLRETTVTDAMGRERLRETYVCTADGFERIGWQLHTHDRLGRVIETLHANGTRTASAWGCCGKTSETDVEGVTTRFVYDDLKRLVSRINTAAGVATSFTYDAAGRRLTTTQSNETLSLTQKSRYDGAGRLIEHVDPAGLVTRCTYDRRVAATIRPGGATEMTAHYLDGRVRSVTGTAVVARHYRYGVDPDGHQWTTVHLGQADSPRWEKTVRDLVGRVVCVEKPGFEGVETTRNIYDDKGRLIRIESPGRAATLYAYDSLGHRTMTGLDADGNGKLVPASRDRIAASSTGYRKIDDAWWRQEQQAVLARESRATETTVAVRRQRLTGWQHGIVAEQVAFDIHGNAIRTVVSLDRFKHTRIQNVFSPDSSIPSQSVFVDGRLAAVTTKTGITRTFGYDALGRRIAVDDPRKGISQVHYDEGGRPASVEDAAGHRTRFAYDPETGRRAAAYNPLNKVTRYAYNARGQLIRTWGEVPYPVAYRYDEYGQMAEMRTFRNDAGWDGASWPDEAGPGDATRWHYQPATGFLLAKEDARGNKTRYTYGPGGRLAKRIWARQKNGRPLETVYRYDPATGDLLAIDYSDDTADVIFAYDRLGRKVRVSDAAGIHHFAYNDSLQLESEGLVGQQIYKIDRHYDDLGRLSGFQLDDGYEVSYGFDGKGRFGRVDWRTGAETGGVAYRYLARSDRLEGMESKSGLSVVYDYEPHRDVKTAVTNRFQDRLISRYAYDYDPLGRRINARTSGEAFEEPGFWLYGYNDRSEVTAASRFRGEDLKDQTRPLPELERGYQYDPIGNRIRTAEGNQRIKYQTNSLNQYGVIEKSPQQTEGFVYDPDGNLIEDGRFHYSWNGENRLVAVESKGMNSDQRRIEYVYDYLGRRILKKIYNGGRNQYKLERETRSIYFGWNCIKESVIRKDEKPLERHHVWNLDLSQTPQGAGGAGGLLSTINGSMTYTYCFDANGSVRQVVDQSTGNILNAFDYDPFGGIVSVSSKIEAPISFSTKDFDYGTGLYYYGFRHYNPLRGRWLNRDPISDQGGINLYTFVLNNGTNAVDKLGLISYVAYRKLNIPGGKFLWNQLWKLSGHVYMAFHVDGEGVSKHDRSEWCRFLISQEFTKKAFPELNAKEYHEWITFSFHPASVDPATYGSEGNLLLTLITTGSYVELNNIIADINPAAGGGATTELITEEFEDEKRLFLRAFGSFKRKGSDYAGVFGEALKRFNGYGLFNNNCGGWAKYIVEGSGLNWPPIARLYNGGVAVGGPLEYPTKIIDAFVRGIYFSNYDNSEEYDEYLLNTSGMEGSSKGIVLFRIPF